MLFDQCRVCFRCQAMVEWRPAQDVAERIEREAKMRHFSPRVQAMDSYPVAQLPREQTVVFVASTTGQVRNGRLGAMNTLSNAICGSVFCDPEHELNGCWLG